MPRFFLLPSHRSKRFHSKQQDSAPSPSLSTPHTHPLKPGYNRQTPQQRPFCSAAVGDAGSVLHQGGSVVPPSRERRGGSPYDAPLREHPTDHPAFSTREPNTPSGLNDRHAPRPPGCSPHPAPSQNETPRGSMPLLARPFLMPSRTAPADALLRNNIPGRHIPLDPRDPSPLRREGRPEEGASNPAQGKLRPLSHLSTIQNGSAYDDHPDCAVFPAVKPPGANPTNASSPRPAPSHGLRERDRSRLEQGPSTPPGPPPPDRGGGGEGGRPPVGSGGGPSRRGGSAPPERYLPSPYIYPFSDFG